MKHEFKVIPKEEILSNRSNAYEFINFDKQETLEEIAQWAIDNRYPKSEFEKVSDAEMYHTIIEKVSKWQQERMYSEEEVLNFTQTMIMQYKFGNTNIEQMDLLKETLQKFKNK